MPYMVKALLDTIAMVAVAVGTAIASNPSGFLFGSVIIAVGFGIKAASEYLAEQGIITKGRK